MKRRLLLTLAILLGFVLVVISYRVRNQRCLVSAGR
jgi:hypothetical protein